MDVEFGDFEFSTETMKLRKGGTEMRVVGQPFHLLVMLLETPGKVVTREEIRRRLWPDTHVDFDHSVHAALNRLRTVLGDRGKEPRFIETVPTVGYRFIARVTNRQGLASLSGASSSSSMRRVMWFVLTAVLAALLALGIVRMRYDKFVPHVGRSAR